MALHFFIIWKNSQGHKTWKQGCNFSKDFKNLQKEQMVRKNSKNKHYLKIIIFCKISEKGPVGGYSNRQEWCKMGPDSGLVNGDTKVETL